MGETRWERAGRPDELAAIAEVLRGDRDAFRLVVDRYSRVVFRLSLSFLRDREAAEEAAQEIFLRAFRSLRRFNRDKPLLPWLYAIAVNHLRTAHRRMTGQRERTAGDSERLPAAPETDPQHIAVAEDDRRSVRRAVAALPPSLREPVILYYFEELSVEAISSILGIGAENVKSRLFRARRRLRQALRGAATAQAPAGYTGVGFEGSRSRDDEDGRDV